MSVPPDRMAARTPGTIKDPNKIMGVSKPVFFVIIAAGAVLAWYLYKKSQSSSAASLQTANAGTEPDTTNGVTAADIGGTPADNSFATQTDEAALEEQIQSMQNSLFQLEQSNGGNGAGITPPGVLPTYPPGAGQVADTPPTISTPVSTSTPVGYPPVSTPFTSGLPSSAVAVSQPAQIVGVTPDLTAGNGVGNSPTAMQNLYAAGITPTYRGAGRVAD